MSSTAQSIRAELQQPQWPLALHALATGQVSRLLALAGGEQKSIANRVTKILTTRSTGVPARFENAWHWAADWIATHGVTLPPDTTEYRSLRNWFCYQVNMNKKGQLSQRSRELLSHYGIDLSQYRASNTGRGELLDDERMIRKMRELHAISGSYDLPAEADPELVEWQRRLLEAMRSRGTSARMRAIEQELPGLRIATWLGPLDKPIPAEQLPWWDTAQAFRTATRECPAYRGDVDPRTPDALASWAREQADAARRGQLTPRQKGELMSLGVLATSTHERSRQRHAALKMAREATGAAHPNSHERDMRTFLGAALLVRLLAREAPLIDLYSTLAITPSQYERMALALREITPEILRCSNLKQLGAVRSFYQLHREAFDRAGHISGVPESIFAGQPPFMRQLADIVMQCRAIMRRLEIRQALATSTSYRHAGSTTRH